MSSYAAGPTRQLFLARFEEFGDGYLYRRTPAATPVQISAKDYTFMVDRFDSSWLHFPFVTAFAAACAALFISSGVSQIGSSHSRPFQDIAFAISALWFVGAWYADLWDIPDRALFQQARDTGRITSLPWLTKSAGDMSWRSTTLPVFWGLPLFDRMFANEAAGIFDKFLLGVFILWVTLMLLIAVRKVQLSRSRSLSYLN